MMNELVLFLKEVKTYLVAFESLNGCSKLKVNAYISFKKLGEMCIFRRSRHGYFTYF